MNYWGNSKENKGDRGIPPTVEKKLEQFRGMKPCHQNSNKDIFIAFGMKISEDHMGRVEDTIMN